VRPNLSLNRAARRPLAAGQLGSLKAA